ncbi:DUF6037 family protein [Mannheimia haemolytica]|uniref:DUF6037 family protein n=1 Tax=Mannheimia haemolytica TaxID=75985 RepID=UPI00201C2C30|nr:DUF6037 family protein [Mannheimia haemolytica]UQX80526.1 DUF6037 family protein [Mannheimia haemolytica]
MSVKFNLTGLHNAYSEAIQRRDFTFAFEVSMPPGRFIFFMFFAENDKQSKDLLYLYLQNTNRLEQIKLYGSHRNGNFEIYLNSRLEEAIRAELGIVGGGNRPFSLYNFFEQLNRNIPQHLPAHAKIDTLRQYYPQIRERIPRVVNDAEKIYWMGFMRPKNGTPREQTLRKLYIHTHCNHQQIDQLLQAMAPYGVTLRWTDSEERAKRADFASMINELNRYKSTNPI